MVETIRLMTLAKRMFAGSKNAINWQLYTLRTYRLVLTDGESFRLRINQNEIALKCFFN